MLKVVHFIHGLNMGGAETLVKNYALLMDKSRFKVIILCYDHYKDSPYEDILRKHNIDMLFVCDDMPLYQRKDIVAKIINRVQRYLLVRKKLGEIKPDIIHYHLTLGSYVKFARPNKKTKLFYTQHFDVERWKNNYPSDINATKWLCKHYSFQFIALNKKMKSIIDQMFNINNTQILNNGINMCNFQGEFNKKEKRNELGIPENAFVVSHIGRFVSEKNHKFLIEIFAEIKQKCPEAFLLMVGTGDEKKKIINRIKEMNLENSYLILSNRTDVAQLLRASDAAVFPSISEGLGISVIEMQAAGLPCVVSDAVPKDTCISNKIYYMSLREQASSWANKLLDMVNDTQPIILKDIAEWDIKNNVKQLECMYQEEK